MTNVFDYLKKEGEAREEKTRQEQIKAEQAKVLKAQREKEESERLLKEHIVVAERYNEVVADVLEQLIQAAYSNCELRNHPTDASWAIVHQWLETSDTVGIGSMGVRQEIRSETKVSVTIKLDSKSRPLHFLCWREGKKEILSGLSRDELIQALRKLHPPGES